MLCSQEFGTDFHLDSYCPYHDKARNVSYQKSALTIWSCWSRHMPIVISGCCPWTLRPYAVLTLCCQLTHTFYRLHLSIYVLWSWKQRGSGFYALLCYQLQLLRPNKQISGAAKLASVGPCKSKLLRPISGRLHSHLDHVMKCRNPSGERYEIPVSCAPAVRVFLLPFLASMTDVLPTCVSYYH